MNKSSRRSVLFATTAAAFLTAFMGSSLNIALPTIGKDFGLDAILLSWVPTSYSLAAAMFLVPLGRIADMHGRKRIFVYGLTGSIVAYLLAVVAPTGPSFIVVRVLQGIAAAMMFGTSTAMLTSSYPPGERGRVLGINVASVYTGLSIGPFLGGLLTQNLGWHSIFVAGAVIALGAALLAGRVPVEWAEAKGERFDLIGAIVYGITVVAIMYGLSRLPGLDGAGLMVAGLVAGSIFVIRESRIASPILNTALFRANRVFAFSNLAALINYSATAAIGFLLSLYLQYIKGLSPQNAGLVLIAQPIMQAIFSPMAGRLSDRVESRIVASAGMACTAAGLALLTFLNPNHAVPLHHRLPDVARVRLRALFIAQHQRGDERCGTQAVWRGVGDRGNHAADRPDVEPGHRDVSVCAVHRPGADHAPCLSRLPDRHAHRAHDLRGFVLRRHLRLTGPGQHERVEDYRSVVEPFSPERSIPPCNTVHWAAPASWFRRCAWVR